MFAGASVKSLAWRVLIQEVPYPKRPDSLLATLPPEAKHPIEFDKRSRCWQESDLNSIWVVVAGLLPCLTVRAVDSAREHWQYWD